MPLAVGDRGVSIKISANLMTLQKARLDYVPFPPCVLGRKSHRLLSGLGQTPVSELC